MSFVDPSDPVRIGCRGLIGPVLALGLLVAPPAFAADLPGDPVAGQRLAEDVCAECHAIAPDRDDPGIAPTFMEAVDHPAVTEMALRVFLQTPHATMPDIRLNAEETDDIISYLLELQAAR